MTLDAIAFRPDGSLLIREIVDGIKVGRLILPTDDLSSETEEVKSFVLLHRQKDEINKPDWGSFIIGLLQNKAYNLVRATSADEVSRNRQEIALTTALSGSLQAQGFLFLIAAWNATLVATPEESKPSTESIAKWIGLAESCNLPISFNPVAGEMIPN